MSTDLAVAGPWYARLWRALTTTTPQEREPIGVAVADAPTYPDFDPTSATAAYRRFPWLAAGVQAICADLSGLPLVVKDRRTGEPVEDTGPGSLPWLLAHPSTTTSAELVRRQVVLDLVLAGCAYLLMIEESTTPRPGSVPLALQRLHPAHVTPITDDTGRAIGYTLPSGRTVPPSSVLHFRLPSWNPSAASIHGTGAAAILSDWLTSEAAIMAQVKRTGGRGRLDVLLTPKTDDVVLTPETAGEIRRAYERNADRGGALVVGSHLTVTPLSMAPRDLEQAATLTASRDAQLAVLDVPPVRVGIPGANYATDQAQRKGYWESLQSRARLLDAQLTRLAERVNRDWYVCHDFSGVEALQESRGARVQRVTSHILNGLDPVDAYEVEGLDEAASRLRDSRAAELAEAQQDEPTEEASAPSETDEERGLRLLRAFEAT